MARIFIDGQAGATGLQIADRLRNRKDLTLLEIPPAERKNSQIKREFLNSADLAILCLPDDASKEAVGMIENKTVKVIDASTAFRTDPRWIYGLPELEPKQRQRISEARFVANTGCYAAGFLLAIAPLIRAGIVPKDYPTTIQAVSGYSGGGRQLIERYESRKKENPDQLWHYRPYSLRLAHKHLPEMQKYSGLKHPPHFVPAVGHFEKGMLVSIPLLIRLLKKRATLEKIHDVLLTAYKSEPFVRALPLNDFDSLDQGFLSPLDCNDTNRLDIFVHGNRDQALITSRLDNLGKGASGAAVQNLNIMLGMDEANGLMGE